MMKKIINYHWRALLWALFIVVGCLMPADDMPQKNTFLTRFIFKIEQFIGYDFDKIVHFVMYFIFSLLLMAGFTRQFSEVKIKSFIFTFSIAVFCGVAIELIQPLTGRSCELFDMVANILGIAVGLLSFYPLRRILRNIL